MLGSPTVLVADDVESLARQSVREVHAAAAGAIAARGSFVCALAGGSTPKRLYSHLAGEAPGDALDWARLQLFFGDERCVPPHHPDSNFGMVKTLLLDHIGIPSANVHRMQGELADPAAAAAIYERELLRPLDLALLGVGADGHTASLFPRTAALAEVRRACVAVDVPDRDTTRLTLTMPVFLEARALLFLVTGPEKADILRDILEGIPRPADLPSQVLVRRPGPVTILCDRAAAAHLTLPPMAPPAPGEPA